MNKMKTNTIAVGKYIIIPIPVNDSVPSSLSSYLNNSERERPGRKTHGGARQQGAITSRAGKKITYKVRTGETLYSISNTFGVAVKDLMAWNYLASPRSLKAEQTLVIYQTDNAAPSQPAQQVQAASDAPIASKTVSGSAAGHSGKRLVKQGETLYGISQELGVSVSELTRINGLNAGRPLIFPGDVLIYTPGSERSAQSGGGSRSVNPAGQTNAPRAQSSGGQVTLYTVKSGDNLWRIAANFGVTVDSTRKDNNLTPASVITPGDILRIMR
jgi:membrane-bound lytic murein transglycosylase D